MKVPKLPDELLSKVIRFGCEREAKELEHLLTYDRRATTSRERHHDTFQFAKLASLVNSTWFHIVKSDSRLHFIVLSFQDLGHEELMESASSAVSQLAGSMCDVYLYYGDFHGKSLTGCLHVITSVLLQASSRLRWLRVESIRLSDMSTMASLALQENFNFPRLVNVTYDISEVDAVRKRQLTIASLDLEMKYPNVTDLSLTSMTDWANLRLAPSISKLEMFARETHPLTPAYDMDAEALVNLLQKLKRLNSLSLGFPLLGYFAPFDGSLTPTILNPTHIDLSCSFQSGVNLLRRISLPNLEDLNLALSPHGILTERDYHPWQFQYPRLKKLNMSSFRDVHLHLLSDCITPMLTSFSCKFTWAELGTGATRRVIAMKALQSLELEGETEQTDAFLRCLQPVSEIKLKTLALYLRPSNATALVTAVSPSLLQNLTSLTLSYCVNDIDSSPLFSQTRQLQHLNIKFMTMTPDPAVSHYQRVFMLCRAHAAWGEVTFPLLQFLELDCLCRSDNHAATALDLKQWLQERLALKAVPRTVSFQGRLTVAEVEEVSKHVEEFRPNPLFLKPLGRPKRRI